MFIYMEYIINYEDDNKNNFFLYKINDFKKITYLNYHIVDFSDNDYNYVIIKNDGTENFKPENKRVIYKNINLELEKIKNDLILYTID